MFGCQAAVNCLVPFRDRDRDLIALAASIELASTARRDKVPSTYQLTPTGAGQLLEVPHGEQFPARSEEFKAWSQNLGPLSWPITLASNGRLAGHRQSELIRRMAEQHRGGVDDEGELIARMDAFVIATSAERRAKGKQRPSPDRRKVVKIVILHNTPISDTIWSG